MAGMDKDLMALHRAARFKGQAFTKRKRMLCKPATLDSFKRRKGGYTLDFGVGHMRWMNA
jgi:hypothetical protein